MFNLVFFLWKNFPTSVFQIQVDAKKKKRKKILWKDFKFTWIYLKELQFFYFISIVENFTYAFFMIWNLISTLLSLFIYFPSLIFLTESRIFSPHLFKSIFTIPFSLISLYTLQHILPLSFILYLILFSHIIYFVQSSIFSYFHPTLLVYISIHDSLFLCEFNFHVTLLP